MSNKTVHFIGMAGSTMAPLAKMFADMGWKVTGSDYKNIFPPASTYLEEHHLTCNRGYSAQNLFGKPDLLIVGRADFLIDKNNPEVEEAKRLGCQLFSYPEVLRDFLIKNNSVVVAGTYGKTTTTALIAWILDKAGFNPSYMIGAQPLDFADGLRNTSSSFSVVEGDETPSMSKKDPSKFLFYKPKFLLLTAAQWDHPEIFETEEKYVEAFKELVDQVPEDGLVVVCQQGKNLEKVINSTRCLTVWYSSEGEGADYSVRKVAFSQDLTKFVVYCPDGQVIELETVLMGNHNLQNITGAVALCYQLGVKKEVIQEAIKTFKGIKNRLEDLGTFGGVRLYSDFAQHPVKVKVTLAALRTRYPKSKIFCVFNPHSSILQQRKSLEWYEGNFDLADQVLIAKVSFPLDKPKGEWVTGPDIVKAVAKSQKNVFYEPREQQLVDYLIQKVKPGDVILFLSSGGLTMTQAIEKTKERLERR